MGKSRSKLTLLVFLFSLGGLTLGAECIENAEVYWSNGTVSTCEVFCIVYGGYIARNCSPQ
jgi:hypothetical protein